MSSPEERKKTAPYISFQTFNSGLDAVANAGVPNIIDRHSFRSFSGGAVAAILSAFRFFDLVDNAHHPQEFLHALAKNKDDRKANIAKLLAKHFDSVIAIDLMRATPGQLDEAFNNPKYNVTGATKRKAQAFFLKAAQFADVEVGPLLLSKSRNASSNPKKPKKKKPENGGAVNTASDGNQNDGSNNGGGGRENYVNPAVIRTPIPLGLGRIAYVELPKDWQQSDLRKLIGILQLSLGDGSESSTGSA